MDFNLTTVLDYSQLVTTQFPLLNSTENDTGIVSNRTGGRSNPHVLCLTPYCIPSALSISIISVCGIIANLVVMVVVKIDKRLHQPTFVAIATLALPDFTFLVARYIRFIIDGYFYTSMSRTTYFNTKYVFDFIGLMGGGASVFHLVMLSILRYFIVVHPLKSHVVLTTKVVLWISLPLWVVATGNGAFYFYAVVINTTDKTLQRMTNLVVTLVMTIFPVVVIGVLHTFKARVLMTSLSATENTVRKMSRVITFVICSYLITTTPINLWDIANLLLADKHRHTAWFYNSLLFARILLFMNYAINPFIYFMFSPQFKRFFSEQWSRAGNKFGRSIHKNSSYDTDRSLSTHLTSVSQQETYHLTQHPENKTEVLDK